MAAFCGMHHDHEKRWSQRHAKVPAGAGNPCHHVRPGRTTACCNYRCDRIERGLDCHPAEERTAQQARNLIMDLGEQAHRVKL
jgi:hypothetical protein